MKKSTTRSPLKASPLRVPGQSVEEEREKLLSDVQDQWLLQSLFFVLLAAIEWYRYFMDMKPSPWLLSVTCWDHFLRLPSTPDLPRGRGRNAGGRRVVLPGSDALDLAKTCARIAKTSLPT
jgi:hypothetical protein